GSEISAHGRRAHAAQQSADLRGRWNHRALHRHQDHRHRHHASEAGIKEFVMKKNLITAVLMTIVTTLLLGIIYPLVVTGLAQLLFPRQANGQLIEKNGRIVGSQIIGQGFSGASYFHSRPSAAGNGYDAANTNGSQLGPTNEKLIDRVKSD